MGVKTRIGLGGLARDGMGSVELPEDITLYCPECGEKCADKGNCFVFFRKIINTTESTTRAALTLAVDCRSCGCMDKKPAVDI